MPNAAEIIEQHFPWYIDSSDTDYLDCQCGHEISGGLAEWSTHVAAHLASELAPTIVDALLAAHTPAPEWVTRHGGPDSPYQPCDDPHCQDCALLGLNG